MNSTRIVFLSPLCLIIRYSLTVWQSIQKRSPKDKKQRRFLFNGHIHIWQQNHDEVVLIKSFLSDQHQLYDVIILPWVTKLQRRPLHPRQRSFAATRPEICACTDFWGSRLRDNPDYFPDNFHILFVSHSSHILTGYPLWYYTGNIRRKSIFCLSSTSSWKTEYNLTDCVNCICKINYHKERKIIWDNHHIKMYSE